MPDISTLHTIRDKDQGFNETGPGYDICHRVIGEAKNRSHLPVSTKVYTHSEEGITEEQEQGDYQETSHHMKHGSCPGRYP
jgi:hypothetical protein